MMYPKQAWVLPKERYVAMMAGKYGKMWEQMGSYGTESYGNIWDHMENPLQSETKILKRLKT